MKKLYMEYFKISDDAKITDKAMLGRVISMVAVILVCVAVMSITAFAYFTSDASSSMTPITSASFEVDVVVTDLSDASNIAVNATDSNLYSIYNKTEDNNNCLSAGEYAFVITRTAESTASTGYCVITIGDDVLHTYQLSNSAKSIAFTLKLAQDTLVPVTVEAQWGTSIYYADYAENVQVAPNYILNGDTWPVVIPSAVKPDESDTTEQTDETNVAEESDEATEQLTE